MPVPLQAAAILPCFFPYQLRLLPCWFPLLAVAVCCAGTKTLLRPTAAPVTYPSCGHPAALLPPPTVPLPCRYPQQAVAVLLTSSALPSVEPWIVQIVLSVGECNSWVTLHNLTLHLPPPLRLATTARVSSVLSPPPHSTPGRPSKKIRDAEATCWTPPPSSIGDASFVPSVQNQTGPDHVAQNLHSEDFFFISSVRLPPSYHHHLSPCTSCARTWPGTSCADRRGS